MRRAPVYFTNVVCCRLKCLFCCCVNTRSDRTSDALDDIAALITDYLSVCTKYTCHYQRECVYFLIWPNLSRERFSMTIMLNPLPGFFLAYGAVHKVRHAIFGQF